PGAGQAAGGGGLRHGHAAGIVDRFEPGSSTPRRGRDHRGAGHGPGGGGRGVGGAVARGRSHGDGGRRRAGEHRHRRGRRPGGDGPGLPAGGGGGTASPSGPSRRPRCCGRAVQPPDRFPREAPHLAGRPGGDRLMTERTAPSSRGFTPPEPAETFAEALDRLPLDELLAEARLASPARVGRALEASPAERTLRDFAALLSPAASTRLEDLAQASRRLTLARFGRTMRMYAPLY